MRQMLSNALATSHPLSMRLDIVLRGIPVSFAHSCRVCVTPLCVISRLLRRLFCWTVGNTHRQLSFVYGWCTLIRSIECLSDGGCPISAKNCSKESHLGSTKIPFAPYLWYPLFLGLLHLLRMPDQILYTLVLAIPCDTFLSKHIKRFWSLSKHPQDFVSPVRKACPSTSFSMPHEQRHFHNHRRFFCISLFANTVRRPNLLPDKSINAPMFTALILFLRKANLSNLLNIVNRYIIMNTQNRRHGCL